MTPEQKFARYVELCELADEAMDRAITTQTPEAWRAAEARNADAADYWRDDVERTATAQAMAYRAARHAETMAWLKS